ncbi:peptidoglycan recognition protein family protein [Desulfitobacterium metallireducens]|uniref:N-acetylmuramoyl-L-alanine amidase domain-containing protein n=1 Tax=Desulfitobacterium metallireducens DSM 15288 TaxID=871968 RepID=W0EGA6_9FIRM|nr:peptidoglycan recognition family protein [Desulfitobacterium metallireducens]AHF08553.1 hypothetical protein DESME_08825 [Desulfitobacterium metallireducens DSM 15288]
MEVRPCKITLIDLHHSAGHEKNTEEIRQYHKNIRGYGDIGYSAVIESDGTVGKGRDTYYSGAHDPGLAPDGSRFTMNQRAYSICHIGNFQSPNADKMTDVQFNSSVKHCVEKCKELGIIPSKATIKEHKDQFATACPGDNFPYDRYVKEVTNLYNGDDLHMERVVLLNTPEPKDMILVKEYFDYTSVCPIFFRVNGNQAPEEVFKANELVIIGGADVPNHPNRKYFSGASWFGTVAKVGQNIGQN